MPSDYEKIKQDNIKEYGEGTRHLAFLKRLYSDRTHFVYEILQNAEDAKAKKIRFDLYSDRLEIRHNGREFNEKDVRGICGVDEGTKTDDLTQIGKFGIGFKSIYAFTTTPKIYSVNRSNKTKSEYFQIENYVRPTAILPMSIEEPWTTLIIIPFNSDTAENASSKIAERLGNLGIRTLLFLKNLKEITYKALDVSCGTYKRESKSPSDNPRRIKIFAQGNSEKWLVFHREVATPDKQKKIEVEIAFSCKPEEKSGKWVVEKLTESPLVAFFPTEKETHLGFLIQGPYRTTPARDNIPKDDVWNRKLIGITADLLVDSLKRLKSEKLLTVPVLECLPIDSGKYPENSMLHPIFERVRETLRSNDLLPKTGGGYVSAKQLKMARAGKLRDILKPNELSELYKQDKLFWSSSEITQDRTPQLHEYLTGELKIEEITPERFASLLTEPFLADQSDDWFERFYEFLLDLEALWRTSRWKGDAPGPLRDKTIIRLEGHKTIRPFKPDGKPCAYLPSKHNVDLTVVSRSISSEDALKFLKRLGLPEPDEISDIIDNRLAKYRNNANIEIENKEYQSDINAIFHSLKTDSQEKKERLLKECQATRFVKAVNAVSGEIMFRKPDEVYLPSEDIRIYFAENQDAWFVCNIDSAETTGENASAWDILGISCLPRRIEHERLPEVSPSRSKKDKISNYDLDGLETFFERMRNVGDESILCDMSKTLWRLLQTKQQQQNDFFEGRYVRKGGDNYIPFEPNFLVLLRSERWLHLRTGAFVSPPEAYIEELSEDYGDSETLAKILGIKQSKEILDEDKQYHAEALGINESDLDDLDWLKKHREAFEKFKQEMETKKLTAVQGGQYAKNIRAPLECPIYPIPDILAEYNGEVKTGEVCQTPGKCADKIEAAFNQSARLANKDTSIEDDGKVTNPDRRRQKTDEEISEAIYDEPAPGERIRVSFSRKWESKNPDTREALRDLYNGECQICHETFPTRACENYFEGVYVVPRTFARWVDRPGNILCLCPKHCAMFLHGSIEANDIMEQILAFRTQKEGGNGKPEIRIRLCGEEKRITYKEKHLLELQEMLKSDKVNEADEPNSE